MVQGGESVTLTIGVLVVVFAISLIGTQIVRRFALKRSVLDVPNERSSHSVPTPRGGGVAIAIAVLSGLLIVLMTDRIPGNLGIACIPPAALIAWLGWLDDRRSQPAALRLAAQVAAASWAVYWIGAVDQLVVGTRAYDLGPVAPVVSVVGLVWLMNLFNFMDGIDGIAGVEALVAMGAAAVICMLRGDAVSAWIAALIAVGALGFLPWNWAPAKIFMGDSGSVFLGFLIGVAALSADVSGGLPILGWVVLMGVFVVDATLTILRRIVRRERFSEAHRSHAYQRAVTAGFTHAQVSSSVFAVNLALGLAAAWSAVRPADALVLYVSVAVLLGGMYLAIERLRPM